ncbi:putative transcription factor B3-Domain family [Arabidopsis thaliana]
MANQHFFKPLFPGFHSHLVKIDGQRLTNGWKDFALAHDLRLGDIIVFRQERDMTFHVTMLGPSCCDNMCL